jgi:SAM-dependent methyltransferase
MTQQILEDHRQLWKEKPVLRAIYADFYRRILGACRPGRSLEVGGGFGNLKEYASNVISTDIVPFPGLDAVADAQALPFQDSCFDNIVAVDVLHHVERPQRFFSEAERVLRPGGRIILVEPGVTPVSWIFYKLLHPEPLLVSADPFVEGPSDPDRKPFDANQAIPELVFGRYRREFENRFASLKLVRRERFSWLVYPLSGGFRRWSLIPERCLRAMIAMELKLTPFVAWLMAFRLFLVVEKLDPTQDHQHGQLNGTGS